MSVQNIKKIDLNDIVFEGKNKEYGAYTLRKAYQRYLSIATGIAVAFFVISTSAPIIYGLVKPKEEVQVNRKRVVQITELAEPPSIDEKQEQVKVEAPPPQLKSTIAFLPPVVKPDEQVTEEYIPTVQELHDVDPGTKTVEGQAGGVDYSLLEVQEPTQEQQIVEVEKKEEPFTFVEEMPMFPEGNDALMSFIIENIQYPEIAKRASVEGRVLVQFVVEKSGQITEVKVVKGIGAGCDEEAVRVTKLMGKWKPGKQNGKPVRVRMVIPFQFKLQ